MSPRTVLTQLAFFAILAAGAAWFTVPTETPGKATLIYRDTLELGCNEIDAEYSRYMEEGTPSFESYLNRQEVQRLYELCIAEQEVPHDR